MKVLLVSPAMPPTFWTMDHLMEITGRKASYPPLGLLTVAALLPRAWKRRLVDLNVEDLHDEDLRWADFVFVGGMNVQAASARNVIARSRAAGTPIVAGGPLFTHEHEAFEGVDHFVLNEAEITLPLFLRDLENGDPKPIYSSPGFADVHETPIPEWDLVDLDHYAYAIVQYSRGCPYECDFCDVTALFGRRPRTKKPEQILKELEALGDLGRFDLVLFADDNLLGNKKQLKNELLPALIDWRRREHPPTGFATQITINLADDEAMMQQMLEAGFRHIFIGIETPEEDSLKASKKRQNTKRDLLADLVRLQGAGFVVTGGFIVGFDADTEATFDRQIKFIEESGVVVATVNLLKAPPGTELYDRMKSEGRLIEPFSFDENDTNFIPLMDVDALSEGYDRLLRGVYTAESVYRRFLSFMRHYEGPRVETEVVRKLRLRDIGVLLRAVYYLGIREPERRYFWKLLWWTYRKYPSRLESAFLAVVLMYQFRKMYERHRERRDSTARREWLERSRRWQREQRQKNRSSVPSAKATTA